LFRFAEFTYNWFEVKQGEGYEGLSETAYNSARNRPIGAILLDQVTQAIEFLFAKLEEKKFLIYAQVI
jgi:hypothetical protein